MDAHPSYPVLSSLLNKYPRCAGSLFQAYNDILLAQKWQQVEVIDLDVCSRAAITGYNSLLSSENLQYVVPCSIAETISLAWLKDAFLALSNPPAIYLAITSEDASIVYYKISPGLVKPSL